MEAILIHLAKSSALALLFLGCYLAFLRKETFYISNRFYLIAGTILSIVLPFFEITKTVWVEREPISYGSFVTTESTTLATAAEPFNWSALLITIYLIGASFFAIKLLVQLQSIKRLKRKSDIIHENDIKHVRSKNQLSPFSFFKNIFYCPDQYDHEELNAIITHEKAHARQHHSADVLFMQVVCILLWFNPLVWIYKHYIKQNLEFLADNAALQQVSDKKQYQYLMLKQAVGRQQMSIVNPFFNTLIKKRIVMLNQKQSKPINALKLLFVLPFLVLFLVSFNLREDVKFYENPAIVTTMPDSTPEFVSPLHQKDIKEVSSSFGPARNPFSKEMDFHYGIDLVAPSGKPVMASADGSVSTSSTDAKKGNYIVIEHADGFSTKYMHLQNRSVDKGDQVVSGMTIGYVGNTGKSTGPHLHFEILESGKPVNPATFIPFEIKKEKVTAKPLPKKQLQRAKSIELMIDKKTTNEELEKMKSDLAEDDIDFSYTTVRNDDKEIIDISLHVSGTGANGASFKNSHSSSDTENGISPLVIFVDKENNLVSIGTKGTHKLRKIKIDEGQDNVWISSSGDEHKEIIIKKGDGERKIFINGEEVDEDELHEHDVNVFIEEEGGDSDNSFSFHISTDDDEEHEKHVRIKKHKSKKGNVMIIKDSDDDSDIEVMSGDDGFFFIDSNGKDPLYIIDGKEATKKEVKKLSKKNIETIDVSKGKAATKKYGKKAKDGVVEITTKKKN